MASMPKKSHIASACAWLFLFSSQSSAQTDTQLAPVVVTGTGDGLTSPEIQSGFGGKWIDQSKSVNSITREQMDKTMAQKTSEVLRNDASVQANYSPLGYYEGFSIRGFGLDYGTAYQLNGMSLAAEAHIPLENKERVEVVKGIAGTETGAISPGGYINFVTKRPTNVNRATIGYGERGSFSQSADFGRWLNPEKTLGIRLNAAHEEIKPYAKEATGHRKFISASVDVIPSTKTKIETDFDYQKKSQFTQPGLQLLGGTTLPPINPEQVLAVQPWRKPVKTEQTNFGTRLTHELESGWELNTGYQFSKILSSDNSSFPWGGNPTNAYNYFSPEGDFTISDFQSNQEIHQNQEIKIEVSGTFKTHLLEHQLLFGASTFSRKVSQPNYIWDTLNDAAFGNIYSAPNGLETYDGTSLSGYNNFDYRYKQNSLYIHDQVSGLGQWAIHAGGRLISSQDKSSGDYLIPTETKKDTFLPSATITYKLSEGITNYISHSKGLELGGRAPLIATNVNSVLPHKITSQLEIGAKALLKNQLQMSIALFEINKPYEYTEININDESYGNYVQRGTQKHTGLELGLAGNVTKRLGIKTSAMIIDAVTEGTGDQFDGKKAMNVPNFKISTFASYKIPNNENTSLNTGWVYESSKYAKRDNTVKVPGYHRIDAGVTQLLKINNTKATLNFYIENIFDKGYWRDASEYLGDAYLITGAPRIFRATATFDF